jgi:hypothetical protein
LDAIDGFGSRNLEIARKLSQAVERLRPVTDDHISEALGGPDSAEIREYLTEIVSWADGAKPLLE